MKSAKEWILPVTDAALDVGTGHADLFNVIRAIQLDAFKSGMERAASLCVGIYGNPRHNEIVDLCKTTIERAASAATEADL